MEFRTGGAANYLVNATQGTNLSSYMGSFDPNRQVQQGMNANSFKSQAATAEEGKTLAAMEQARGIEIAGKNNIDAQLAGQQAAAGTRMAGAVFDAVGGIGSGILGGMAKNMGGGAATASTFTGRTGSMFDGHIVY